MQKRDKRGIFDQQSMAVWDMHNKTHCGSNLCVAQPGLGTSRHLVGNWWSMMTHVWTHAFPCFIWTFSQVRSLQDVWCRIRVFSTGSTTVRVVFYTCEPIFLFVLNPALPVHEMKIWDPIVQFYFAFCVQRESRSRILIWLQFEGPSPLGEPPLTRRCCDRQGEQAAWKQSLSRSIFGSD